MTLLPVWNRALRRSLLLSLLLVCDPAAAQQVPAAGSTTAASSAQAPHNRLVLTFVQGRDWTFQSMEIVKGLVLFKGRLNGRPVTILLDNGAGRTIVDTSFARQAGIPIGERAGDALTSSGPIKTFKAGPTVFEVPGAFTMSGELVSFDLGPMSRAVGRQIDVVLGHDATGLMAVMLQPDRKQLSLVNSGAIKFHNPDTVRFPIIMGNQVEASINGHKVTLMIDFGYSGAIKLSDAAWRRAIGGPGAGAGGPDSTTADGMVRKSRVATAALRIGRFSSQAAPIASGYVPAVASDGLLGTGFFLQGTSVVDGPAKQVMMTVRQPARPSPTTTAREQQ